jgi:hypothetical protein
MTSFFKAIQPYFHVELDAARQAQVSGNPALAFSHLERAHILGQASTKLHIQAHWHMLLWSVKNNVCGEFFGQLLRLIGAATKTAIGFVPDGNSGGNNVSPFHKMPIAQDLLTILQRARTARK